MVTSSNHFKDLEDDNEQENFKSVRQASNNIDVWVITLSKKMMFIR